MSMLIDGTNGVTYPGGGVQLLPLRNGTATTASGTSVNFTSLPAGIKRITICFAGISTNGASSPTVRIGTGGTPQATGYSGSIGDSGTPALMSTGFLVNPGASASATFHGQMILSLISASTNTWVCSTIVARSDTANMAWGAGSVSLSGTLDNLRFTTNNGTDTFDSGTINILYE